MKDPTRETLIRTEYDPKSGPVEIADAESYVAYVQLEFSDGTLTEQIYYPSSLLDFPYELLETYGMKEVGFSEATIEWLLERNSIAMIEEGVGQGVDLGVFGQ